MTTESKETSKINKNQQIEENFLQMDDQKQSSDSRIMKFWQRIPLLIRATILGVFVSMIGIYSWIIPAYSIPAPWPFFIIGAILLIYWKYFSGSWWSESTKKTRIEYSRSKKISAPVLKWSLLAAIIFVIIAQSSLVVTFRIIPFPAEAFTSGNRYLNTKPVWLAWVIIGINSLVAGICEETGIRGYTQVPVEKRYGPIVGISFSSILFLIIHINQAWFLPIAIQGFCLGMILGILAYTSDSLKPGIIAHSVMDVINFSYWWSDIAGRFEGRPIAETGIDLFFIISIVILVSSILLFIWTNRKIMAARNDSSL
ncbi:MAG: CPBP family intramembrane metalloprotease [Candidatus Helarchaeota archaeon]|nr:CPBP family intramembrane metalloprotease [Candidatus Helarchaeota archaeon]